MKEALRKCTSCKEHKKVSEFHKNRSRGCGLSIYCKPCKKEKSRVCYLKYREKRIQTTNQYHLDNRSKRLEWFTRRNKRNKKQGYVVYKISERGAISYIGLTSNPYSRANKHKIGNSHTIKKPGQFEIMGIFGDDHETDALVEKALIAKYKPKYNKYTYDKENTK